MRKNLLMLVFSCLCLFAVSAKAQQTLGSLNGTILDPSGAAVGSATVTATDTDINVTRTTKTQGNGFFQIFNLPVGTYQIRAEHDGFDTSQLTGIAVQESHATTVNVTLKIGQVTTSVEVTTNPMLNATDTTNGYTLDAQQIGQAPLATGSFTQLAVLSPGVNAELLGSIDTNAGLGNQPVWANGQRDTSNTFLVNGVDASNLFNGKTTSSVASARIVNNTGVAGAGSTTAEIIQSSASPYLAVGQGLPTPAPESVQEFRVNTSMYDAEQGSTSGAHIDMSTASGANAVHGQAYWHRGTGWLNAAPFFYNQD